VHAARLRCYVQLIPFVPRAPVAAQKQAAGPHRNEGSQQVPKSNNDRVSILTGSASAHVCAPGHHTGGGGGAIQAIQCTRTARAANVVRVSSRLASLDPRNDVFLGHEAGQLLSNASEHKMRKPREFHVPGSMYCARLAAAAAVLGRVLDTVPHLIGAVIWRARMACLARLPPAR
jgi:hypothetical protein